MLLSDLVKLMRPLYELMEAKDHALVRPTRTNLDGTFDDAAAEKPAAEQTLAEMCAPCAVDKADSYYERASLMFLALAELWTFTHQNDMKSSDITLGLWA
mmetsp:Transcript_22492/g.60319  ORF Transcript_22492/g.60319 Transcript_22492/m.60319 type:complete len:100 (+) Transcript_22492:424-723(+)